MIRCRFVPAGGRLLALAVFLTARPPVRLSALFAQCPDGTPPPCARIARAARARDPHGVAVLYLADLSHDSVGAAIADGLTEEIIARLSQVQGLHPASRYASLRYRGPRTRDPQLVGRELGMRYVLDGTLRRSGQRLRVVLVMTDASQGFNVWGQTFERPLDDIFSIEDTVAVQVAVAILGRLTSGDRAHLAPVAASASVEAYQAYLRGRVAIRGRTAAAATAAIAQYRQAIALDPRFARAWAGLSQTLSLVRDWGWAIPGLDPDSVQPQAERAADGARALDSSGVESWLAAAMAERARDMRRALRFHQRAVALDSSNVEAIHQLAWGFFGAGELDSAIVFERRAIERDPFYAYAYAGLAEMLNVAGDPAAALAILGQGRSVDSMVAPVYWQIADASLRLGRTAEAQAAVSRLGALGFDPAGTRILRALVRLRAGDTAAVRAELPAIEEMLLADSTRSRGGIAYTSAGMFSGLLAQLGDPAGAVRWAELVAAPGRRIYALALRHHWLWEPVRADPRFQALLATLQP